MKTGSVLILALALAFAFDGCKKETLPIVSFTYEPTDVMQYDIVKFTNTSTDADNYLWDFNNGAFTSTETNPKIVFESAGSVVVKLTATNCDGSNSTEQTITVNAANLPTAAFTYSPETVIQFDEVQFINTSTDANSYSWDFGNDQTSTEANPKHTFMTAGDVTVKLTATNGDSSNKTEQTITVNPHDNHYMLDDTKFPITTDLFWFQSSMGGDPYLRLITDVPGQDTVQDLLKLYPNKGLSELSQTYTWNDSGDAGTYDHGYTADYDGTFSYDWTAIGKTGSSDLYIQEVETGVYKITGDLILSVGTYDWSTGEFTETSTKTLVFNYVGAITPLP